MTPQPPVDIRLHLYDGTIIPVEAVYVGDDEQGLHVWRVVTTKVHVNLLHSMTMATMPPRTTIVLDVDGI